MLFSSGYFTVSFDILLRGVELFGKVGEYSPLSLPYGRFIFLDSSSETGLKVRYVQGSYIEPNEYIKTFV